MDKIINDFELDVATAHSRLARRWRNRSWRWSELLARCEQTQRTAESMGEYLRMSREEQSAVKDVGGVVGGYLSGGVRKTANVILSVVYNRPAMAVDTHVFRVAERIGLTRGSRNPLKTEQTLTDRIPEDLIPRAHHWLILHGRYTCTARNPKCKGCFLKDLCRAYPRFRKEAEQRAAVRAALKARPKA